MWDDTEFERQARRAVGDDALVQERGARIWAQHARLMCHCNVYITVYHSENSHGTSYCRFGIENTLSELQCVMSRELQKATSNFTTVLGQGAFGPVYKADMSSGEILAVKVLANNSKQGEKEFHNEVLLLGRLHHRNLAVPPVIHRDIKSPNILLDQSMSARVADFGLSREETVTRNGANIRGTYGYLDPEYISSRSFTKKSDVYSYGVLLFELIAGRNPQQGLMEYVELAAINVDGRTGWEEIADSRLEGAFDVEELNDMAAVAQKCVSRVSRKRPAMRDVVQALARVLKHSHSRKHHGKRHPQTRGDDESVDLEASEVQSSLSGLHREELVGSVSDLPEV
ncbi:hypothetical protein PR202_ga30769 [Eleusine coracana subsp. coracana]|uniref:Protein kinase domain-containing protein n=1 Tax=Eleusine coracana subsp. coracana TaxID=191504 RepID=A0AAV5DQ89_ELECO|nr:hypothetical protein PR202_ga30769 [Eleusine coracana subsp. coracana]